MKIPTYCLTLLALLPCMRVSAQTVPPAVLLAQAKEASGGSTWDSVRNLHLHYQTVSGGLAGTLDEWEDVRTGRIADRRSVPASSSSGADGYDGISVWTQPSSSNGYAYVLGDEDARQGAINEAYQTCRAYWFPERANGTLASAGVQQEGGQTFDVVSITPQAGRPFDVWIDRTTHRIDRYVEQQGEDVQIIRLRDYGDGPGGLKLPFTVRIGDSDPQWDDVYTLQTVAVNALLPSTAFSMPPDPAPDYQFKNGKASTTVPFRLVDDKLLINIRLNGHGPFEAELDSGGSYIVQPALSKRLHLKAQGADQSGGGGEAFVASGRALMDSVEIGGLRLTRQSFDVLPFSSDEPERCLIGQQLLQRFVISINFDTHLLTFTRPDQFVYHGSGQVVPFHFQDNQPEVKGIVDGIAGVFAIDTGDSASGLLLIAPFVKRYDLVAHYGATIPYTGGAIGGDTYGLMTRTGTLSLCGADGRPAVAVSRPVTRLSQQKSGFDANRYVSGNIGMSILEQFNLIFDYHRQQIIFEKNRNYGKWEAFNRTGLRLGRNGLTWDVLFVAAGSPAAQVGIKPGDKITAINKHNAVQLTSGQRYMLLTQPVGTKIGLTVLSGTVARTVTLTLRDVL